MTTARLARQTRHRLSLTADWMLTPMAAVMAQVDEQVRGQAHGTVPALDDDPALGEWLTRAYGPQDAVIAPADISPAAALVHRLRATQARRIRATTLMPIAATVATACRHLAATGAFRDQLPAPLPTSEPVAVTLHDGGTSVTHVETPGADLDRTIDCLVLADGRALELAATTGLQNLPPELAGIAADLPPLIPDSDVPWETAAVDVSRSRRLVSRAADAPQVHEPTTVEIACALTHAANAGLVALERGRASTERGLESIISALPPSRPGREHPLR